METNPLIQTIANMSIDDKLATYHLLADDIIEHIYQTDKVNQRNKKSSCSNVGINGLTKLVDGSNNMLDIQSIAS
jgi:hypothetical protein